MTRPKLLFLVTEDWYFCSHRLPIAREAIKQGYDVVVATRVDRHGEAITQAGCKLVPLRMERQSANPFRELATLAELVGVYRREKPDVVHHVALKPVLYGSLAAFLTGVPNVVNALAGMGYAFISNRLKVRLLRPVLLMAFRILMNRRCFKLILQNQDDCDFFLSLRLINKKRMRLIRGAGVDTVSYRPTPELAGVPLVVLPSRMLWDKGVGEFVEAAGLLKERGVAARFVLVGDSDPYNPAAIPAGQLQAWSNKGIVSWWGRRDDMPAVLAQSHLVCLPSYREGLPKSLLEAASCGRPIVTTDANGCREVVRDGENGFLVPVKNVTELADALQRLIEDPQLRQRMGRKGRTIVEQEFAVERVVAETISVYKEQPHT